MRACLIVPALLCFLAAPAAAQVVTGQILTSHGDRPVAAAGVRLLAEDGETASAVTDTAGRFVLRGQDGGTFRLAAEAKGLRSAVSNAIELGAGDSMDVRMRLSPDTVLLEPLEVVATQRRPPPWIQAFYRRAEQRALGTFITREQIDRRAAFNTTQLLSGVPGLRVSPSRGVFGYTVRTRGGCIPAVYIDGVPLRGGAGQIDQWTKPERLEGIEVYTGAVAPPQFGGMGSACGVIALWTRADDAK